MDLNHIVISAIELGEAELLRAALNHQTLLIEEAMLPPGVEPDMGCWEAPEAESLIIKRYMHAVDAEVVGVAPADALLALRYASAACEGLN